MLRTIDKAAAAGAKRITSSFNSADREPSGWVMILDG
jgi:hypothetical protein